MKPPHEAVVNSSPLLNISIFGAFILLTLVIVYRVSSRGSSSEYFAARS